MICELTDYMFPMQGSVYYPIVDQGDFGAIKKHWVIDKQFACIFSSGGTAFKEEVKPNISITQNSILVGRVKSDLRVSSRDAKNPLTNILITDIKDKDGNIIYMETSGPRSGKGTLFEVATYEPFFGPFGTIDFYRIVIRRSENQAGDLW